MNKNNVWSILSTSGQQTGKIRIRCKPRNLHLFAAFCFAVCISAEYYRLSELVINESTELKASKLAQRAMETIRAYRMENRIAIDPVIDPNSTGLLGIDYSDITTTEGSLRAKRTSTNPNFAGLIVRWLDKAGVQKGDNIAISFSGSFPALNISVLAACQILQIQPHIISSVGSSNYGANIPGLTWPEVENILYQKNIFINRSFAISLGGITETGGGIDGQGIIIAMGAIQKHNAYYLKEGDYRSVQHDVIKRKKLFSSRGDIKAFINVGGSLTSLGWDEKISKIDSGLVKNLKKNDDPNRGLIFRFYEENIPVIHLLNIDYIAKKYALPVDPIPQPVPGNVSLKNYYLRLFLFFIIMSTWLLFAIILSSLDNDEE